MGMSWDFPFETIGLSRENRDEQSSITGCTNKAATAKQTVHQDHHDPAAPEDAV